MAENTVNLFDYALAINGPEPITINVGDDLELTLRRNHTGAQVVAFTENENKRIDRASEILNDDKLDDATKATKLGNVMRQYTIGLLTELTVDTTAAVIKKAAEQIVKLPTDARNKVYRTIGALAGVVDENGNPFPSTASSATPTPING
ncbi:hypothetical protein [Corynebacterium sanguinis]|uniref:Uncharacterized protein n=1 Tax=Corynebacterium sanguinis TaxID=2594913 RepID=A0A6C1TZS0_9CORY|nr:hypothetical protein [Corynebacterium sanguinis]TVS29797.1 hypothetical protein EKI59_02430 [Corynebacterium sanguinis]